MAASVAATVVMTLAASQETGSAMDPVTIGTDANFESIIRDNQMVLATFYAPWCGHCKALMPEFAKAATRIIERNEPYKLVKVDATVHDALATKYNIEGYPTIKLFKNGKDIEYEGGRTTEEMIAYLKKKAGPAAIPVDSVDGAKQAIEENEVAVFGLFDSLESTDAVGYRESADVAEGMFFITANADVAAEFKTTAPSILVYTNFETEPIVYKGDLSDSDAISEFVAGASLPLTIEFNDESAPRIFGGSIKNHLLVFVRHKEENAEQIKANLAAAAKDLRGKLLFIHINADLPQNLRILEFFGLKVSDCPAMRIINVTESMEKFVPETPEPTAENIKFFATNYLSKSLAKHLKSQELPEDWNANPVKILTGANFKDVALDKTKNVFVEFYAPWCGHCKQLSPIFDKVGEAYEAHDDMIIAKVDATENEFEDLEIASYPTLKLFPTGDDAEVKEFDGERTFASITEWLADETGISVTAPITGADADGPPHEEL